MHTSKPQNPAQPFVLLQHIRRKWAEQLAIKGIADGQEQTNQETYLVLDCKKCILKENEIYPNKENHLQITKVDLQIVGTNDFEGEKKFVAQLWCLCPQVIALGER